jgi:subfamily B ATP-binding cassette protein MsbA
VSLLLAMRRLLALGRPHHRTLAVAFVFMALVGLSTGAYAWLMGPALQFLLTGGAEGSGWLQGLSASLPRERGLLLFPLVIVALGLVKGVGYLGQFYFVGLFGQQVVKDLRRSVFERMLALSPGQRARLLTGDLLSALHGRRRCGRAGGDVHGRLVAARHVADRDPRGGRGRALVEARAAHA